MYRHDICRALKKTTVGEPVDLVLGFAAVCPLSLNVLATGYEFATAEHPMVVIKPESVIANILLILCMNPIPIIVYKCGNNAQILFLYLACRFHYPNCKAVQCYNK